MTQRCSIVLQRLMCILKNKAASIETACIICPRNRGGIAFAGADDGALYLDLFPLPYHVLTPWVQSYKKFLYNNSIKLNYNIPTSALFRGGGPFFARKVLYL